MSRKLTLLSLTTTLVVGMSIMGCFFYGTKQETGTEIDERKVRKIIKGNTTSLDILSWFGSPTTVSKLGDNEIYIYKFCRTGGSQVLNRDSDYFVALSGSDGL